MSSMTISKRKIAKTTLHTANPLPQPSKRDIKNITEAEKADFKQKRV